MRLRFDAVTVDNHGHRIVEHVSLDVASGGFTALVGPNGSGKSTVLRAAYRAMKPAAGAVLLDEDDVWTISAKRAAQRRAVVTQHQTPNTDYTVTELVAMGRGPHHGPWKREGSHDRRIVQDALEQVGLPQAGHRQFASLSGGERQRVLVARALAQQAPVIVLDEPTNHLDVRAQIELLDLVSSLEVTVLAALHDLDHAAGYADRVAVIASGRLVAAGTPADVLTTERIAQVFGVRAHVGPHPLTGRLHVAVAGLPR